MLALEQGLREALAGFGWKGTHRQGTLQQEAASLVRGQDREGPQADVGGDGLAAVGAAAAGCAWALGAAAGEAEGEEATAPEGTAALLAETFPPLFGGWGGLGPEGGEALGAAGGVALGGEGGTGLEAEGAASLGGLGLEGAEGGAAVVEALGGSSTPTRGHGWRGLSVGIAGPGLPSLTPSLAALLSCSSPSHCPHMQVGGSSPRFQGLGGHRAGPDRLKMSSPA